MGVEQLQSLQCKGLITSHSNTDTASSGVAAEHCDCHSVYFMHASEKGQLWSVRWGTNRLSPKYLARLEEHTEPRDGLLM